MKIQHKRAAIRLAVVGMALGLAVAGCSKDNKDEESSSASSSATSSAESSAASSEAPSSSAAPAAAAGDLSVLLMRPESIPPNPTGPFVGDPPQVDQTPGNPASVSQFYKSGDNSIQSTIFVVPDAATAATTVKDTMSPGSGLTAQITGTAEPAPNVAPDALVINGTSADGSASMSILMFSVDTAVAQISFIGPLNDPVPPDFLDSVGVIQLDAIQQGLPTLGG